MMGSGSLPRQMEERQIKVVTLRERRKKVKPIKCIEQKETKLESEKRLSLSNGIKLFFFKNRFLEHYSETHIHNLKAIKNYQDFFD